MSMKNTWHYIFCNLTNFPISDGMGPDNLFPSMLLQLKCVNIPPCKTNLKWFWNQIPGRQSSAWYQLLLAKNKNLLLLAKTMKGTKYASFFWNISHLFGLFYFHGFTFERLTFSYISNCNMGKLNPRWTSASLHCFKIYELIE